jgi:Mn-dependent DtxR family transcriptional regulator
MTDKTKQIINNLLQVEIDESTATVLHMEHQLSLPIRHRLVEIANSIEYRRHIRAIKEKIQIFQEAKDDFNL